MCPDVILRAGGRRDVLNRLESAAPSHSGGELQNRLLKRNHGKMF